MEKVLLKLMAGIQSIQRFQILTFVMLLIIIVLLGRIIYFVK